jgi:hypothetical protein
VENQNDINRAETTLAAPEDRRHLYGLLLSLPEFRQAYHSQTGYCRGCKAVYPGTDLKAKGVKCNACGRPRVFGALQYAWNGWIGDLPSGRYRGRSLERLLSTDSEAAIAEGQSVAQSVEA